MDPSESYFWKTGLPLRRALTGQRVELGSSEITLVNFQCSNKELCELASWSTFLAQLHHNSCVLAQLALPR
jgi:hypothetical protein